MTAPALSAPGAQATKHDNGAAASRPITSSNDAHRHSPWGIKRCPTCTAPLDEGPIIYRCAPCGRTVRAADLDNETHAPRRRAA